MQKSSNGGKTVQNLDLSFSYQNSETRIPTDPLHPSSQDARREKTSILYSHTPAPATAIREDENLKTTEISSEKRFRFSPQPSQNRISQSQKASKKY
jgi:hypothetical protein